MALAARTIPGAPWYRQFWPWFLLALPGVAVIGGLATLAVAIRHADSVVRDDWYASGLAINVDLARDRVAADRGLVATLTMEPARGEIRVALSALVAVPETLLDLALHHPTQAERDRTSRCTRDAEDYFRCPLGAEVEGRWHVVVTPVDKSWRIAGPVTLVSGGMAVLAPRG